MRETAAEKADRLLAAGQVRVLRAGGGLTLVRVEGDHGVYAVSDADRGILRCECKAAKCRVRCSHLIAAELITLDR